ncbi:MAG: LacI family transcriptional regulator [Lachnospiraceae bacterium]|nr:LacI family transcriptional regulator [Lachnospiraceae bacterium]
MVTIKDIAKECGVSIATVSNVLNGKNKAGTATVDRVLKVVEKYGYNQNFTAKGLRSKKTGIIGVVVEDIAQFTTAEIVEGLMRYLEEKGYTVMLQNLRMYSRWPDDWKNHDEDMRRLFKSTAKRFENMLTEGVIYVAAHYREMSGFTEGFIIPTVMAYAKDNNPEVSSIILDDEDAACRAVRYLVEKGHKNIGILAGVRDNMHTILRLRGAKRAAKEAGINIKESDIIYGNWSKASGYEACKYLMDGDYTALFSMSDHMTGGVYEYMEEIGKRPGKDLSVISFDNKYLAEFFVPGLTTMRLPLDEIGNKAAQKLVSKIEAASNKEKYTDGIIKIPCDLIERSSVEKIVK